MDMNPATRAVPRGLPKINRNVAFLLVAIGLGAAASLLAVRYVNNQVAARTQTAPTPTRQVVVPVHDLAKGASLTQDDIATRDVPADFVPADAITPADYQRYVGQLLRAPLAQGAPIPASAVDLVTDHFSNVIAPGKVAYTIQVDETSSVSGLIVPGDHVDLLLLLSGDGAGREQIRPLLADVPVLATGRHARGLRPQDGQAADGSYSNITLGLVPADAQRLGMAMKVGELRVMLRPAGADDNYNLKLLSKADLLRQGRPVRGNGIQFIIGGNG